MNAPIRRDEQFAALVPDPFSANPASAALNPNRTASNDAMNPSVQRAPATAPVQNRWRMSDFGAQMVALAITGGIALLTAWAISLMGFI